MNDVKECIFCLENDDTLINYNHCGNFLIHKDCLKKWFIENKNLCIVCKEKFFDDEDLNDTQLILKLFDINFNNDIENVNNTICNDVILFEDNNYEDNNNFSNCRKIVSSMFFFLFIISLFYIVMN